MVRRDIGTDDPRVRVRRGRKGKKSRRRSKDRVDYSDAPIGQVIAVDRGRYRVRLGEVDVRAVKARELGRHAIVVGDRVRLVGDLSGRADTLARLVEVTPRSTELTRSAEDTPGGREKPMVANADLMVIVTACADPPPRPRMIDRCLVAAYAGGISPLLVATKADLAPAAPLLDQFTGLGLPSLVTSFDGEAWEGLEGLSEAVRGHTCVLVGHSGVGKSTLTNALIPEAARRTGEVNAVTGRGRHTSTGAVALELPGGGWLIDTPGIRSFGLAHVEIDDLLAAFADLAEAANQCPRRCSHTADEVECALDAWARGDARREARLDSFRRLLETKLSAAEPWQVGH
ncbi:ribosome small subunit-dependent GTPase A [Nanchangia anserum]|uniref:Small ribosomal subunit biogenesis GTPase RsgA n=1 Tax=Nanchangia anserum TaxID=2692125 RepID=A0A8I0KS50_9ACTO|nr:ribosome small subunit-dependent GTPase A [Nanchangia anserum]MBD3690052.1 ribosome small subunit-dependent GTPase A [Nanchangia anserum]QOX82154.1 ribosome small subunit-dependent GTPase A [Nanchangia anserum]